MAYFHQQAQMLSEGARRRSRSVVPVEGPAPRPSLDLVPKQRKSSSMPKVDMSCVGDEGGNHQDGTGAIDHASPPPNAVDQGAGVKAKNFEESNEMVQVPAVEADCSKEEAVSLVQESSEAGKEKAVPLVQVSHEAVEKTDENMSSPMGMAPRPTLKMRLAEGMSSGSLAAAAQTPQKSALAYDVAAELNSLQKINALEEDGPIQQKFVLNHMSNFKLGWDVFMMTFIFYESISTPIALGFGRIILPVEAMIDLLFLSDVVLNFRTTFSEPYTDITVSSPRKIGIRYLKGWFWVDALSSTPVSLFSFFLVVGESAFGNYLKIIKLLRTLKLVQMKMIMGRIAKKFEETDINPANFRIVTFVVVFTLIVHFIACSYWYISSDILNFEGNWVPPEEYADGSLRHQYTVAMYFSLSILYGNDMKPDAISAVAFSIVCLIVSLLVNAILIGSAANMLSSMDTSAVARKSQMDGINGYMRFRKVPLTLQKRIRSYYEYLWDSGQNSYNTSLFQELPDKLRLQLNLSLKRRLVEKVPLFKTCSPAGIIALVQNLYTSIILPGELVVREGESAECMYFISRGKVKVFIFGGTPGDLDISKELYLISLHEGSFFGEMALLKEGTTRTANVKAETFVELQGLTKEDFRSICHVFPEFQAVIEELSKLRSNTTDAIRKQMNKGGKFGMTRTTQRGIERLGSIRQRQGMGQSIMQGATRKLEVVRMMKSKQGEPAAMPKLAQRMSSSMGLGSKQRSDLEGGERLDGLEGSSNPLYVATVLQEELLSHEAAAVVAQGTGVDMQKLKEIEEHLQAEDG
ncbi:unnamed protein product [Chrysoparadoxa australica]